MTRAFSWGLFLFVLTAVFLLVGIFAWQSRPAWSHSGMDYVTGAKWFFRQKEFGALPMIYGTVVVAMISLVLAGPLGLGTAVFLAEYIPRKIRLILKSIIELLAGIPSVVYGLIGILLLRDWVYSAFERFEPLSGDTLLTAGILLAVMILPTVVTLTDDALSTVPAAQRRAARALGLSKFETIWSISLPQARRGIGAALLLALGRALGETIAVFLVVGRQDNHLPDRWWSPQPLLDAGQTLTSKLGGSEMNIAYGDPLHWGAMMGLGLLLLILTGSATLLGTLRRKNAEV